MATQVIAFDVNETLLDLSVLDRPLEATLGSAAKRRQWFAQMLQCLIDVDGEPLIDRLSGLCREAQRIQRDIWFQ